jgi:hypothetical protein
MQNGFSRFVHGLSWLVAVLAALASVWWISILLGGNNCWDAFAFGFGMATPFCLVTFFIGILPSASSYFTRKQRRDLLSLWLMSCSFFTVLIEGFGARLRL